MNSDISVIKREAYILKFLKSKEIGNAARREIYEAVSGELNDEVSLQAYIKIIERMVEAGKLMDAGEDQEKGRLYSVAPHLNIGNPRTLDDIYEALSYMSPADAIALSIDALEYYAEKQSTTLKLAAEALQEEDPLEIFFGMIEHMVTLLQKDLEMFSDNEIRDATLETRIDRQLDELYHLLYRGLNLSVDAVDVVRSRNFRNTAANVRFDAQRVRDELAERIYGQRFISRVDVSGSRGDARRQRMSIAGTDGSIHAGVLGLTTAREFVEDLDQDYITFNNGMAYVELPKSERKRIQFPYHCVPMTRSALEDPSNFGMVLTPHMFPDLSESKYEHMAKCAIDVVQLRVDSAIFHGSARAMGTGQLLPQPIVLIRDGTVTPQEREFKHYKLSDSYGQMVREGISEYRKLLDRIKATSNPPVFAGSVKSTQLKVFSKALNWYIAFGSRKRFGTAIDPAWDVTRAAHILDNAAMTFLLSSLPTNDKSGKYWVTCAIARPFHSLTEYYSPKRAAGFPPEFPKKGWEKFFERVCEKDGELHAVVGGEISYFEGMTIEDDAFVFMCNNADYVTFYVGHTGGEPPPIVPRYEFMESFRDLSKEKVLERVERNKRWIVEALDQTKVAIDADHNFMTNKKIVKVIPYVTYNAHEKSKSVGKQLQSELKAIVIAKLQELKRLRVPKGATTKILPLSIQKYVERYYNAIKDELKDDPGKFIR